MSESRSGGRGEEKRGEELCSDWDLLNTPSLDSAMSLEIFTALRGADGIRN